MPSVVEASEEFDIYAPSDKCWNFFENITSLATCIPGCESVVPIDSKTVKLKVKLRIGYLSRTFELRASLKEMQEPIHLLFVAEGNDAEIQGIVDILSSGGNEPVHVKYELEIKAVSVVGKTALNMIGKDLVKKQASQFAGCVKSKLESHETI